MIKAWEWRQVPRIARPRVLETHELYDGRGRHRASIWMNSGNEFTWHTYDEYGTGGENAQSTTLADAMREVIASIVVQGWAPGGWKVKS